MKLFCTCYDLTLFTAPLYMGACAKMLCTIRHRKQQTKHYRHPNYRHHIIAHHAHWIAPSTPLWSRHFRSGTTLMESGVNLGGSGGPSIADAFSLCKGVIWLFVATFAEVPPVVCLGFVATLSFFSLQYFTGVYFLESERYLSPPPGPSTMSLR